MTTIVLNTLMSTTWRRGQSAGGTLIRILRDIAEGIGEGRRLLTRYEDLSARSDSELAQLGLTREDIPRAVVLGKRG